MDGFPRDLHSCIGGFIDPHWDLVRSGDWWSIPTKYAYFAAIRCSSKDLILWLRERKVPWDECVLYLAAQWNPDMVWWILKLPNSPKGIKALAGSFSYTGNVEALEKLDKIGYYWFEPYHISSAIRGGKMNTIRWLRNPKTGLNHGGPPQTGNGTVPIPRNLDTMLGKHGTIEIFEYFHDEEGMNFIMKMEVLLCAKRKVDRDKSRQSLIDYIEKRFSMTLNPLYVVSFKPKTRDDLFKAGNIVKLTEIYEDLELSKIMWFFWDCLKYNQLDLAKKIYDDFEGNPPGWSSHCYDMTSIHECVDIWCWLEEKGCPKSTI